MDCLCKFGAQQDTTFFRGSSVRGTLIGGKTRFVDKAKYAMRMLGLWKDLIHGKVRGMINSKLT